MYDLLHAMEGSEEEEGLRAHIIVLIKVMCCLFQDTSAFLVRMNSAFR